MSVPKRTDVERQKDRERYYEYKKMGICPGCGSNKPVKGKVYCLNCSDAQAVCNMIRRARMTPEEKKEEYLKRRPRKIEIYNMRKEAGLCVHCGKPSRPKRTTCVMCADKYNRRERQRRAENYD